MGNENLWQGGVLYYENITKAGTSHNIFQHVGPYKAPNKYLAYMEVPHEDGTRSLNARKKCSKDGKVDSVNYDLLMDTANLKVVASVRTSNGQREDVPVNEAVVGIKAIVADLRANEKKADAKLRTVDFKVTPLIDIAENYAPPVTLPRKPAQAIVLPKC